MANDKSHLPFIPAKLDDYGLSLPCFRVYCHIARRTGESGDCWESVPNMAAAIDLHVDTVRKSLRDLIAKGLIQATERAGQSTIYNLGNPTNWHPSERTIPLRRNQRGSTRGVDSVKTRGVPSDETVPHPSDQTIDKGTPLMVPPEGNPKKGGSPAALNFNKSAITNPKTAMEVMRHCEQEIATIKDYNRLDSDKWRKDGKLTEEAQAIIRQDEQRIAECLAVIRGSDMPGTAVITTGSAEPKKKANGASQTYDNPRLRGFDMEQVSNSTELAVLAAAVQNRSTTPEQKQQIAEQLRKFREEIQ